MSSRVRLISIAAVIAVIGVVVWKCRGGEPAPSDAPIAVRKPESKARLRLRDLARQKPGTVAGKVVGEDKPLGGALVCGRPVDDVDDVRCASTAANGSYELVDLRPGSYQLWASAAGFAGVRWHEGDADNAGKPGTGSASDNAANRDAGSGSDVAAKPGGGSDSDKHTRGAGTDKLTLEADQSRSGIDFTLSRGGKEVAGRVSDTRRMRVGGALVHARVDGEPIATTRTAADGTFRISINGTEATIEAVADGYVEESVPTLVPATEVEIVLLPEATLSGVVIEAATKTPVPDARVIVGSTRVVTDDAGTFRATKLRPGRYKPVAIAIGGYGEARESVLLRVGARVEDIIIEVHPVAVIAGRIAIEGTDKGCPEGEGSVQLARRGSREYARGKTILEGDVLIEGVVPGSYAVHVMCAGHVAAPSYPDLVVGGTDIEDVVWTVKPGTQVTGRVTARGVPVDNAAVTIHAGLGLGARVSTAGDGTFTAGGLPVGEVRVTAIGEGYAASEEVTVTTSLSAPARVDLVLGDKTGGITGVVVDRSGKPLANQRVEARSGTATAGPSAESDLRGEFTIPALDPGTYKVVVESKFQGGEDSRLLGQVTATVTRGNTTRIQLPIDTESSRITGIVVDARGQPIPDVAVDVALSSPDIEPRRRDFEGLAWTSATGLFEIEDLPDHALAVRAQIAGANEVVVDNVRPGQHVRLVLAPTGVIAGVVTDPSGGSVEDLLLEIEDRAQNISRAERLFFTGGKFAFRDLPAGTYRLTADEDRQTSVTITLGAGETRDNVQLALRPRHAIRGRLVSAEGKPLPNYKLEVPHKEAVDRGPGDRVIATYEMQYSATDARGEFLIEGLVGAEITLSAGDMSVPDPKMVDVKTIQLTGPPVIDLGDLTMPKP